MSDLLKISDKYLDEVPILAPQSIIVEFLCFLYSVNILFQIFNVLRLYSPYPKI